MELPPVSAERFAGLAYAPSKGTLAVAGTFRKSIDTGRHSVTAVLTYPIEDLAGDIVDPAGCDFRAHELAGGPVDVEHSRTAEFGNLVIAKAVDPETRKYAVEFRNLKLDDGDYARLPVATSYFDPRSKPSMQVFEMVERDILPGVSLEFRPLEGRPLGPSPLENRDAYAFSRVEVVRYTHCAQPVNPGALTVTKSLDALIPVIQTGRLPGGQSLDPRLLGVLKKSISRYTPKRVTVSGGFTAEKAMDDNAAVANEPSVYDSPDVTGDAPPRNGITALYAHVEGLLDVCDQLEQDIQATDSPELLKQAQKICEMGRSLAEKAKTAADKHDARLSGTGNPDDEENGDVDTEGDEDTDPDMDRDDEGTLKAIRPSYVPVLKALRAGRAAMKTVHAKRFSQAEIQKSREAEVTPEPVAGVPAEPQDETLEDYTRRILTENPNSPDAKKIRSALRQAHRARILAS